MNRQRLGNFDIFDRCFLLYPGKVQLFFNGIMLTSCVYMYRVHAWCLLRFEEGYDSLKMQLEMVGNNHVNADN